MQDISRLGNVAFEVEDLLAPDLPKRWQGSSVILVLEPFGAKQDALIRKTVEGRGAVRVKKGPDLRRIQRLVCEDSPLGVLDI